VILYAPYVTSTAGRSASVMGCLRRTHPRRAGCGSATAMICRRVIRRFPPFAGPGDRLGSGQSELVKVLVAVSHDAYGIEVSPEHVELAHTSGLGRMRRGYFLEKLS
jgi:hypothetical protein